MVLTDEQIAEAWLGVLGVSAFLDGGTVSLTPEVQRKVQSFPAAITEKLTRFFKRSKASAPDIEPVAIKDVSLALYELPDQDEMASRLAGFPDAMTVPMAMAASRGILYLRQEMPETLSRGITAEYKAPSPRDAARFGQCFAVADDPLLALDLLVAGVLSSKHVDALSYVYPKLYDGMRAEILAVMADVYAGQDRIELPPAREKQLYLFTRGKEINQALLASVQEAGAELQQPPRKPRASASSSTEIWAAASDKVA